MLVYWLMFFIPAFALLGPARVTSDTRDWIWRATSLIFIFIIGLRYEVGADWFTYLALYEAAVGESFSGAVGFKDPGFALLNVLSASLGLGVYSVNLLCSAIVMAGVYHFCRRQPRPWLALLIAVPYMLIVVAMGYTRQSVALGFELLALIQLGNGRLMRFVLLIACAGMFHKTAVFLLPLGVLASTDKRIWLLIAFGGMAILFGGTLVLESYSSLVTNYIDADVESEGGPIRVAMNAIPATLYLLFAKRFSADENERRLWIWMAIFSLACVPLVGLASTAVDRVALYFLPIQIFVYSRISCLFRDPATKAWSILVVVAVYGVVEWVILNKATIVSVYWVPYQNAAFL